MRAGFLTMAMAVLGAGTATAADSATCNFSDDKSAFTAVAKLGAGDSVMAFEGSLELRAKALPEDLRKLDLKLEDLTQRWVRGNDIKLVLYRMRPSKEPDPQVEVEVLIDTKRATPTTADYRGSYVLTIYLGAEGKDQVVTVRGRAKCSIG